ncbi:zf-TFIIB domain-containing protein [Candidatus Woesearchaeota archaeon]|nr:zf-TFIIB domain-containing protein [Candidatus Woesearchaeota archaeon]
MDKEIHCPRCSGIWRKRFMRKVIHPSGATLDVCDNCGGMWLDKMEVKMLYDFSKKSGKRIKK